MRDYATVWDLPRNSVEACHAFWLAHDVTDDDWRVMLRLQDDSHVLREAAKSWIPSPGTHSRRSGREDAFNASQPRDRIGRFADVEGRVASKASEQRGYLRGAGKSAEEAEAGAQSVANEERAAIANEKAALEAGHVREPPREKLDQLIATQERVGNDLDAEREKLDNAQREALDELDKLRAFESEFDDLDVSEVSDDMERASDGLRHGEGSTKNTSYEGKDHVAREEPEEPTAPDPADYTPSRNASGTERAAVQKDYEDAKALYERDVASYLKEAEVRRAAFKEQAEAAQVKLEQAHQQQLAAREQLRAVDKDLKKAARAAESESDVDAEDLIARHIRENDDGGWDSPELEQAHSRALRAAESMIEHQQNSIPDMSFDVDEASDSLKQATRSTIATIGKLSKVTGRKFTRKK